MNRGANSVDLIDDFSVIKEGDTVNSFLVKLVNRDGTPRDLTGATVTWTMAQAEGKKGVVLSKSATVESDPGVVRLEISESDQTGSGSMRVEIKVEQSGQVEKFPGFGYLQINISPTLDNVAEAPVSFATIEYFNTIISELQTDILDAFYLEGETWEV